MQDFPASTQDCLVINLARMTTIHARLKHLREQAQLSMVSLAAAVGVSWQTVQQWENGRTAPQRKRLERVAEVLGTTVEYLLTGVSGGYPPSPASPTYSVQEPAASYGIDLDTSPDTIRVRKVIFKISAGIAGFAVDFLDNGEGTPLYFPKAWADKKGLNPEKLYATRVSGSSMYPKILPADVVVVNTADTKRAKDAVCAINHEGEFTVKRLKYEHRRWWLVSDNPDQHAYPPKECTEGTYILGRVVHLHRDF